jgi:hypothetical protein
MGGDRNIKCAVSVLCTKEKRVDLGSVGYDESTIPPFVRETRQITDPAYTNCVTASTRFSLQRAKRSKGMQRASRFTTLPVRYALPLMACSAALHWLCSHSFFMVRIDGVDTRGVVDEDDQLVRLRYNATGVVALIGVSVGAMVAAVLVAWSKRVETPLGETSMSVVISAARHQGRYEAEPWLGEVQWGDVTDAGDRAERDGMRHCAFSTGYCWTRVSMKAQARERSERKLDRIVNRAIWKNDRLKRAMAVQVQIECWNGRTEPSG